MFERSPLMVAIPERKSRSETLLEAIELFRACPLVADLTDAADASEAREVALAGELDLDGGVMVPLAVNLWGRYEDHKEGDCGV
jgi:hypothetical protein